MPDMLRGEPVNNPNPIQKLLPVVPETLDLIGIQEVELGPSMQTRYECELCDWKLTIANVQPAFTLEDQLRAHFESHDVTDWLRVIAALRSKLSRIQHLVNEQAEDDGLWFFAAAASEAYLQQELRRLHAEVEA